MPPDNKDFRTWRPLTNERYEREIKLHPHDQDHADVQFTDREWSNMGERENLKEQAWFIIAQLPNSEKGSEARDLVFDLYCRALDGLDYRTRAEQLNYTRAGNKLAPKALLALGVAANKAVFEAWDDFASIPFMPPKDDDHVFWDIFKKYADATRKTADPNRTRSYDKAYLAKQINSPGRWEDAKNGVPSWIEPDRISNSHTSYTIQQRRHDELFHPSKGE